MLNLHFPYQPVSLGCFVYMHSEVPNKVCMHVCILYYIQVTNAHGTRLENISEFLRFTVLLGECIHRQLFIKIYILLQIIIHS